MGGYNNSKCKRKIRNKLVLRDGPNCWWCGCETQTREQRASNHRTIDHVIPRCEGGTNVQTNLRISCSLCNLRRNRHRYKKNPKLLLVERYKIVDRKNEPKFHVEEIESNPPSLKE